MDNYFDICIDENLGINNRAVILKVSTPGVPINAYYILCCDLSDTNKTYCDWLYSLRLCITFSSESLPVIEDYISAWVWDPHWAEAPHPPAEFRV